MGDDLFKARLKNFAQEGELAAFNLAATAEALDTIRELNDQNVGGETVEKRIGEYKSWDPEIFKVDKDTEQAYTNRVAALGRPVVLLSEEAGRLEINTDKNGDKLYAVCDPFDGSYLFKRGIPDFWYSSFALFDHNFNALCCAVGDGVHRKIAFASDKGAFIGDLAGDSLDHKFKLGPDYREQMGRRHKEDFDGASIESYAMKPKKFLSPLLDNYRGLMERFQFFLPNGGPYGFADVAEGKIDCYFAPKQPFVDVFSGIMMAEKGGAVVTDFEGNPVRCSDNVKSVHDVVASTNRSLHDKVLEEISKCRAKSA
jgi:fructose-1,6-bisphosphatase/inositol monophosphatase family enzyme